uniref:Transposable element protein n=1 Tax=Steinernema glaseri TaxID=37863 RepID=A0A1I7XYD5_9BILA
MLTNPRTRPIQHPRIRLSNMERVPVLFIESVLQSSGYLVRKWSKELSTIWGQLAEVFCRKDGVLYLCYAHYDESEWRLHYKLSGFDHIKTRTLSREVVKEISKTIASIQLYVSTGPCPNYEDWDSIHRQDENGKIQLLLGLDAPVRRLCFQMEKVEYTKYAKQCEEMISRYSQLFKAFTCVEMRFFESPFKRLVEDMVSSGRLWSMRVFRPVIYGLCSTATSFWVDYFFSGSCRKLSANFPEFSVIQAVIDRWKKMDPRFLASDKIFTGIKASPNAFVNVGITWIPLKSVDAEVLRRIERKLVQRWSIQSLHCIDHPLEPSSRIYVVFQSEECSLLFV